MTCASSAAIAGLSAVFAFGFILSRAAGTPFSEPLIIDGIRVSLLLLYGVAFVCCAIETAVGGLQRAGLRSG